MLANSCLPTVDCIGLTSGIHLQFWCKNSSWREYLFMLEPPMQLVLAYFAAHLLCVHMIPAPSTVVLCCRLRLLSVSGVALVCVCACVRACVRVSVWCSGLCSRLPIETLRVRSPPSAVTHVFLLLLYLSGWLPTAKCVCLSMSVLWGGRKKNKKKQQQLHKWNCHWPKQPLGAVWCKTRLLNSGGQFDLLCNLIGGAILAQVICACAYDYHRL